MQHVKQILTSEPALVQRHHDQRTGSGPSFHLAELLSLSHQLQGHWSDCSPLHSSVTATVFE